MIRLSELTRFYRILRIFLSYGLDEIIPDIRLAKPLRLSFRMLFWIRNRHKDKSLGERLRLSLQELGPVWIKLGQMLSTRRDLLSKDIVEQLAILQDQVKPFDGKKARQLIENALGGSLETWFSNFDEVALASGSIAQVHTATLNENNKEVILKVIRPDIQPVIEADIRLMYRLAGFLLTISPKIKRLHPREVVREYEKTLLNELDLLLEAANTIQLRRNFEKSDMLYLPEIYSDYCRSNVMVAERIYGIPVSDIRALRARGVNLQLLAERGLQVFFTQVFRDSFFHADMHPGNIFVSYENPRHPQYIAIDCGIVGTLNHKDKHYLAENFLAFFNRDYRKVAELHVDSGWVKGDVDMDAFEAAIRRVCEPMFNKPLAQISYGNVLVNLFNTARQFSIEVQPQLVLLEKTLIYVEGLGRQLYPQLNLWKTAKPFLEKWMLEQVGMNAMIKKVKEKAPHWMNTLPDLPDMIYNGLVQQSNLQRTINVLNKSLQQQRKQQSQILFLLGIGSVMLLIATLLYINQVALWPWILGGAGLIVWCVSWKKTI